MASSTMPRAFLLMHVHLVESRSRFIVARLIDQRSQVFESDPPIELRERTLNDLLEFRAVEGTGIGQSKEVTPRFWREATPLVRSHYPKSHPFSPP